MNRSDLIFYLLGKRYRFDLAKMVRFVTASQYWTEEQVCEYQLSRVKTIVEHAYKSVPYYSALMRKIGMKPEDLKSLDDLKAFPILRKETIQNDFQSFLARGYQKYYPITRSTGGTTGVPFKYYNDIASWGLNWATKIRTFNWGGYKLGQDRIAILKGGSLSRKGKFSLGTRFWRYMQLNYTIDIMQMSEADIVRYLADIRKRNIRFIRGYPSALLTLARSLNQQSECIPMKGIFTTAEMLYDDHREEIQKAFGCEVTDAYGCGEGMAGASQCEVHAAYHVNIETSILEILAKDGMCSQPGEEGEIVVTSLNDFAMPFIRYAPGDLAVAKAGTCSCGRQLPLIEKINGRASDLIKLPNGRILNGLSIPFEALTESLQQFQLVQEEDDRLVLYVIPKGSFNDVVRARLQNILINLAGSGVRVEVQPVTEIKQTVSGKRRYIISRKKDG